MLGRCPDTQAIIIESLKQASLADRSPIHIPVHIPIIIILAIFLLIIVIILAIFLLLMVAIAIIVLIRCGALHVGDILLSVCGQPVGRCTVDEVLLMVVPITIMIIIAGDRVDLGPVWAVCPT